MVRDVTSRLLHRESLVASGLGPYDEGGGRARIGPRPLFERKTIVIGDDIEVTVVDIRGDKVRIGVTAPKAISVHRKEVYDAIQAENRAAARVADPIERVEDATPPGSVLKVERLVLTKAAKAALGGVPAAL